MPIEINQDIATQIQNINELIFAYRNGADNTHPGLTTGAINNRGGFPVRAAILGTHVNPHIPPTPGAIRVSYNNIDLDVVHVGGQICGFVTNPNIAASRKFIFFNNVGRDGLDMKAIGIWYKIAGGYGGNPNDIRPCPRIDRDYDSGCRNNLDLSLPGIDKQINILFTAQDDFLAPLVSTTLKDNKEEQERQRQITEIQNRLELSFFTFLLICSEGAKNSLIPLVLITNLIKENSVGGSLGNGVLRNTIKTAGKNCGNGAINYADGTNRAECEEIMDSFEMDKFTFEAIAYDRQNQELPARTIERFFGITEDNADAVAAALQAAKNEHKSLDAALTTALTNVGVSVEARYSAMVNSVYYQDLLRLLQGQNRLGVNPIKPNSTLDLVNSWRMAVPIRAAAAAPVQR